jgi:hypothetical protein
MYCSLLHVQDRCPERWPVSENVKSSIKLGDFFDQRKLKLKLPDNFTATIRRPNVIEIRWTSSYRDEPAHVCRRKNQPTQWLPCGTGDSCVTSQVATPSCGNTQGDGLSWTAGSASETRGSVICRLCRVELNGKMSVGNDYRRIWKEAVEAYFELLTPRSTASVV